MSIKQLSLDALKGHLFEALEGVKNLSDSEASENEKMTIEQASAIVDISGKIIDIYKIQVAAIRDVCKMDGTASAEAMSVGLGLIDESPHKLIG